MSCFTPTLMISSALVSKALKAATCSSKAFFQALRLGGSEAVPSTALFARVFPSTHPLCLIYSRLLHTSWKIKAEWHLGGITIIVSQETINMVHSISAYFQLSPFLGQCSHVVKKKKGFYALRKWVIFLFTCYCPREKYPRPVVNYPSLQVQAASVTIALQRVPVINDM